MLYRDYSVHVDYSVHICSYSVHRGLFCSRRLSCSQATILFTTTIILDVHTSHTVFMATILFTGDYLVHVSCSHKQNSPR